MMGAKRSKNIFLTGFMGAGKTTTGKALAARLQCDFVDLDQVVVDRENRTIAEIFATDGETYFRDCETQLLLDLNRENPAVYATGGGIVERPENRNQMRSEGLVIYLNARWSTLKQRLAGSTERPLAGPGHSWDDVERLWKKRQDMYQEADIMVETDDLTPAQVAERIVDLMELKKEL